MDRLRRRGHHLTSKWPFCRKNEEALEHLLVHCPKIWGLWAALTYVTRADWARPLMVKDFFFAGVLFQ